MRIKQHSFLMIALVLFTVAAAGAPAAGNEKSAVRDSEVMEDLGVEGDDVSRNTKEVQLDMPEQEIHLTFYGSARLRATAGGSDVRISDNRSRVGMVAGKFVNPDLELFTRIEFGVNLGGSLDNVLIPKDSPPDGEDGVFSRVSLLGIGTKFGALSAGKQWSVYYDVAGFTDRFVVFGAGATGTYNAGTDGGGSGTGRAENSLKYRLRRDAITLGLQGQSGADIPLAIERTYDLAGGVSLVYELPSGVSLGAAYNHATIGDLDDELRALGLTGDSRAAVIGMNLVKGPLYVGGTLSRTRDQEATDAEKFIDARGWEIYTRYSFSKKLRLVAGYNWLDPDDDNPNAGHFDTRSAIFGAQLTYGSMDYADIIYFEMEFDGGHNFDGSRGDNVYTIGFRYSLEL